MTHLIDTPLWVDMPHAPDTPGWWRCHLRLTRDRHYNPGRSSRPGVSILLTPPTQSGTAGFYHTLSTDFANRMRLDALLEPCLAPAYGALAPHAQYLVRHPTSQCAASVVDHDAQGQVVFVYRLRPEVGEPLHAISHHLRLAIHAQTTAMVARQEARHPGPPLLL